MTSLSTVKRAGASVVTAMAAGDWDKADRSLQYLVGAWQRARLRGKAAVEATAMLDDLRVRITTEYDVDQRVGPSQVAWMLAGICSFATQAAVPVELTGGDVESRILEALAAEEDPISTSVLAERVGHSVSATARALTRLRAERLTTGASAGRNVLNGITASGKARVEGMRSEARRREDVAKAWPTSLARVAHAPPSPVGIDELRGSIHPNEIAAVRRARA